MNKRMLMKVSLLCLGLMPMSQLNAAAAAAVISAGSTITTEAKVQQPALKADFSNVLNFKQYSGFTKGQLKMLRDNGFVVMAQNYPYLKMYQPYEGAEYSDTPVFISTDAVLNLYHIFYSDSLKVIESSQLQPKLAKMSSIMLKESLSYYQDPQYVKQKDELKTAAAYFATACLLAGQTIEEVPSEIKQLAQAEKALIDQAVGSSASPISGRNMDYSQYKVRGHYTQSAALSTYFKTMMWYGQMGFELTDEQGKVNLDNAHLAAIMCRLIRDNEQALSLWNQVYTVTGVYAGSSDDVTVTQYGALMDSVYGKNAGIEKLTEPQYDQQLSEAVLKLPAPQIEPKVIYASNIAKGRQLRIMGQRYTIDADVMQQLIEPEVRPAASGLDVMAALGSVRAAELGEKYANPLGWEKYGENLEKVQKYCNQLPQKTWKDNLYNGWLWSIQAAMQSFEETEGMPDFMRSKAWTDKSLMTALGSFAELKHDNVLYSKQAGAERGGPDSNMPYIYVEPNVAFYTRINELIAMTKDKLQCVGCLTEETGEILDSMLDYGKAMQSCAKKELAGQTFTEDEFNKLRAFGGMVDSVSNRLLQMNLKNNDGTADTYTSALISDVSNIMDTNECVEMGTGIPYSIYVICPYKGRLFLAEGTVFSYYEFTSTERLNDEKWHQMLGIRKETDPDYGYETITVGPAAPECRAYRPKWQASYFSDEPNQVKHTAVEVMWDRAMNPNNPQTHGED